MEITFIRHGTTPWNEQGRYQGWADISLSPAGMAEATMLHRCLAAHQFDVVISSDLARCKETAEIVFPNTAIEVNAALREMSFGVWEGLTYTQCMASHTTTYSQWLDDPTVVAPTEGESLQAFEQRIYTAVDAIAERYKRMSARRIAVVTHGGPIRAVMRRVLGTAAALAYAARIHPCGFVRVEMTEQGDTILPLENA